MEVIGFSECKRCHNVFRDHRYSHILGKKCQKSNSKDETKANIQIPITHSVGIWSFMFRTCFEFRLWDLIFLFLVFL